MIKKNIFLSFLIGGLIYFFLNLGLYLDITKKPKQSDLIVCLGGGLHKNRVKKSLDLYKAGILKKETIIFTGIPGYYKNMKKDFGGKVNLMLVPKLTNTMEEVLFVKKFIKKNKINSVIFITEAPHSRRIKIFWDNFGSKLNNVNLNIVASKYNFWNKNTYYKNFDSFKYAWNEVIKIFYNIFIYTVFK